MTKGSAAICGWGSLKKFKEHFEKYDWEPLRLFPESCESNDYSCYFHANIIKFESKGMLIKDPISYMLVKRYVKKKFKKEKFMW